MADQMYVIFTGNLGPHPAEKVVSCCKKTLIADGFAVNKIKKVNRNEKANFVVFSTTVWLKHKKLAIVLCYLLLFQYQWPK